MNQEKALQLKHAANEVLEHLRTAQRAAEEAANNMLRWGIKSPAFHMLTNQTIALILRNRDVVEDLRDNP